MFTTNLFEIKIQQEEDQRQAAHQRMINSLAPAKKSNSREMQRKASPSWMVQYQSYTLSRAAN
jgi:hypothetical protein